MFQVDPQANMFWTWTKALNDLEQGTLAYLISFFFSLRKTIAVDGKAQNQELWWFIFQTLWASESAYKNFPGTSPRLLGAEGLYQSSAQSMPLCGTQECPLAKCEMGDVWILWALSHLLLPDAPSWTLYMLQGHLIQQPGCFTKWHSKVYVYIHIKKILCTCEYHLYQKVRNESVPSPAFFSRFRRYQWLLLEITSRIFMLNATKCLVFGTISSSRLGSKFIYSA